jgi:polyisoprenoid-binding protein YceI
MKLLIVFTLLFSSQAFPSSKTYTLVDKSRVLFHLPYTMGTHDGEAIAGKSKINFDREHPDATTGELLFPIEMMFTGNDKRNCHMREALGLKYDQSDFPEVHVCNELNRLPESGKNAVVFPEITFKISSLKSLDKSGGILPDGETSIEVEGIWNIHGITQKAVIPVKLILADQKIRVQGETVLSLKSFDVIVKPVKILFFTVAVKDLVKVNFDFTMNAL